MRRLIVLGVIAVVLPAGVADAAVVRSTVVAAPPPVNEHDPAADGQYFAWAQNSVSHPEHYNIFARVGGAPRFRVNPVGTEAHGGGISGTTLVYQVLDGSRSNIKLFDLITKTTHDPPAGVNTRRFEWRPSISGHFLLFGRIAALRRKIYLMNTNTGKLRLLDSLPTRGYNEPDQVNGNYAVFMRCRHLPVCNVWRYDIAARTLTKIPNPRKRLHSAPSVSTNGTVFLDESGFGCGVNARIKRYPPGGGLPNIVFRFSDNRDTDTTFVDQTTTPSRLLYTRAICHDPLGVDYDIFQASPITA